MHTRFVTFSNLWLNPGGNSLVWILAGALILISVWLSQAVSQWWLLLTILVSAYLAVSGITDHCPAKTFSKKQLGEAGNDDDKD